MEGNWLAAEFVWSRELSINLQPTTILIWFHKEGFKLQNELAIFQFFYTDVKYSKSYELHTCTYIYFTCLRNYMKFVCIYVVFLSEPYTFITDYIILRIRTQLCNTLMIHKINTCFYILYSYALFNTGYF